VKTDDELLREFFGGLTMQERVDAVFDMAVHGIAWVRTDDAGNKVRLDPRDVYIAAVGEGDQWTPEQIEAFKAGK
jgi:hypothetical protein